MQKKRKRRKQVIRAYIARAICAVVLLTMLILMFCGVLYIRDLFRKDDVDTKQTTEASADDVDAETSGDDGEEIEIEENLAQFPDVSIVIDPGHGGNDGGTTNDDETVVEKDINLSISKKVASLLEAHGVEVILTRTDDKYLSLEERAYLANQTTADLFVSLHCNYFEGDNTIDGLEAFYCRDDETSKVYADSVAATVENIPEIDLRGSTENNYYVTRKVTMDGILIEMGFLSNPEEAAKLADKDYQKTLARAIVDGILAPFANAETETVTTE